MFWGEKECLSGGQDNSAGARQSFFDKNSVLWGPGSGFENLIRLQKSLKSLFKTKEIYCMFWDKDCLSGGQDNLAGAWQSFFEKNSVLWILGPDSKVWFGSRKA